jgi:hypothetical protein
MLAVALLAGADACSSFEEAGTPGADATTDPSIADDRTGFPPDAASPPSEAGTDGRAFCDGHTLCWTFDEPNLAAPASMELRFEKSGIEGSNALIAETSTISGQSRLYKQVPHAGPAKHVRLTCSVRIDTLPVGPVASIATPCAVDDGVSGDTFFAAAEVVRVPEFAKRLDVVVTAITGSTINCRLSLPDPTTWTEVTADVTWPMAPDSAAVVDLDIGGLKRQCTGMLGIPKQVATKIGIVSTFNSDAGADAGTWKYGIDNVALDVE